MGWYNSSWTYRQKITVDATKVDEVFSLLPIYTSRLNIDFFDRAKAGAADVRITQADGVTEIARYTVAHDATAHTGLILANVLADVSISTNTDYYIYYGNSAASDYATSATYGRDAVFAEYEGAYTPGMTVSDLTGAGRDLTAVGTPTTAASTYEGITAAVYNGSTQGHYHTGVAVTNWPITIEALAYIGNTTSNRPAVALVSTASNSPQAYVGFAQTADKISLTISGDSGSASTAETSTTYVANTYYHMMGTRDANTGTSTAYKNGGSSGTETTTITTPTFNTTSIGYLKLATPTSYLAGRVAVALLSNTVRSANYANTMYNAWSTSGFFTAGAIETETGGTTGWVLFQTAATTTASGTLVDWTSVNNALSINADFSSCALDPSANYESETLKLTNPAYGITIPSGETTYGAKFRVKHSKNSGGSRVVEDLNVQLIDNTGSLVGSNLAFTGSNWPLGATEVDYTVSGVSLTDSKFTSSSGLAFSATATNSASAVTAQMITAWMRVDWDTPASDNIGTGAITLGATTVSGTGTEREDGSGTPTLGNVEVSGAGTQSLTGSGAITLAATSVSGTGVESLTGSAQIDLGPTSVSGSATSATIGSGAIVLAPVVVEGAQAGSGGNTGWFLFSDASTELLSESVDGVDWSDPEFALTEFSDYAISAYTDVAESSRYLVIKTPVGISIPSGVSISSIQYRISKGVSYDELPADRISDLYVRPIKGGVIVGDNIAQAGAWSITDEVVDYGGDLLGETWEAADFDENFGLAIAVDYDGGSPMSARIKTVWGKITYEAIEPIEGSGAITLGGIYVESPATLIGSGSIVLGNVEVKAAGNSDFCNCCIGYTMSTLLEIRKRLARESGHYELVADYDSGDYADNGMDEYIRGGARYLDDKFQYDKSEAWFYKKLVEGESLVTFQNNRIIKSVWINKASGDRKKLKRLTLDEIREQYTKDTLAGETNGIPSYWTPAILGLAPEQFTDDEASFVLEGLTDYDLIMFGNHYPHKGIYVMPPCDDTYTVEVLAEWYSAELCDDEDVSFWSQYPEILCMAARREIEIHLHRNTTGAADFERPIIEKLLDLYRNLIAEEVSGPPEDLVMNG